MLPMMTEQQKAENKAAKTVRDRAYAARVKQRRLAVEAAENSAEVLQARKVFDDVNAAEEAMRQSCDAQIKGIQEQIAALQAQIEAIWHLPERADLAQKRREAASVWSKLKSEKVAEAEAMFPDLEGSARFSVVAWQPPQDVLDAMEQARKTATPKPKAA